jgi:hypothetical protein
VRLLALLLAAFFAPVPAAAQPRILPPRPKAAKPADLRPGIPVARLLILGSGVEKAAHGEPFRPVADGDRLRTGDRIRTGPGALARIQLPWMALTVGADSELLIPPSAILSAVLERGRAELAAEGNDLLKLRTPEGEIRGRGRLVVRRDGTATLVMGLAGAFRVEAAGKVMAVPQGQGVIMRAGSPPEGPLDLPPPPTDVAPGEDPVYLKREGTLRVAFAATEPRHHLQVRALDGGEVVVDRDLGTPPHAVRVPWIGTWRVQVSSVDARGLEGPPSPPGYVVVVEE